MITQFQAKIHGHMFLDMRVTSVPDTTASGYAQQNHGIQHTILYVYFKWSGININWNTLSPGNVNDVKDEW